MTPRPFFTFPRSNKSALRPDAARFLSVAVLLTACILTASPALARVKLVTLPVRERVVVQLDHDSAALVTEERIVPLVKGSNQIDFSWAGTAIDKESLWLQILGPAGEDVPESMQVNVLSRSYPPGEQALVWDVSSSHAAPVRVRISYLIGGLSKGFNYRAVLAHDEQTLTLRQYIKVQNNAGESFSAAEILIGMGDVFRKPLGSNQTKEMLVRRIDQLPVVKTYTAAIHEQGYLDEGEKKLNVPMHLVLRNTEDAGLGDALMPGGKVRIFQKDAAADDATVAFLGEDIGGQTPVGDEMNLYVGLAQDVVVRRVIENRDRVRLAGNMYRETVTLKYDIENFKDTAVELRLVERPVDLLNEIGLRGRVMPQWRITDQTDAALTLDRETTQAERIVWTLPLTAREGEDAEKQTIRVQLVFDNHIQ